MEPDHGWAIAVHNKLDCSRSSFILGYTYRRRRVDCIKAFMETGWWKPGITWRHLRRKGYRCVKVKIIAV